MKKTLILLLGILLSASSFSGYSRLHKPLMGISILVNLDDEYEKYKKEGDVLFKNGEYEKAIKKYANCLEVPNFSNDTYAKGKIEQCKQANNLRKKAETALSANKGAEAVEALKQIMVINPEDIISRKQLAGYWENEANKKYNAKLFYEAKSRYQEALPFAENRQSIQILIKNCEEKLILQQEMFDKIKKEGDSFFDTGDYKNAEIKYIDCLSIMPNDTYAKDKIDQCQKAKKLLNETDNIKSKPTIVIEKQPVTETTNTITPVVTQPPVFKKQKPVLKIIVGTVGIGAGIYSLMLNGQWNSKLNSLNNIFGSNTTVITSQTTYNEWQTAYNDLKNTQSTEGLRNACVGIALGAAVLETYLLLKPKPKMQTFTIRPAQDTWGVALNYHF